MRAYDALRARHAALRLDFMGQALDGQVAFTRATTANFFGANGLLQSAASGAPRFDYNPTALTPLGMLMEDGRTNICLRSSAWTNASWVRTTMSATASSQTGPDGTLSYGLLTASGANATCLQTITVTNATLYQFSVRLKRSVGTGSIQLTMDNGSTWTTVAVTSTLTRFTISATSTSTTMVVGIRIVTNTDAVIAGGAQLEVGGYPTSELLTAGTSTARNIDQAAIALPAPAYSDLFFAAMVEFQLTGLPVSGTSRVFRIVGPNAQNAFLINIDAATGALFVTDTSNNVSQSSGTIATVAVGNVYRAAISYGPYGLLGAVNGVLGTVTPVTAPAQGIVQMVSIDLGPAANAASYYQRRLTFWRNALSPERLARVTA